MFIPPGFSQVTPYIFASDAVDPVGNIWWISQRLVAGPYTEG